jgi:hypothetical protein
MDDGRCLNLQADLLEQSKVLFHLKDSRVIGVILTQSDSFIRVPGIDCQQARMLDLALMLLQLGALDISCLLVAQAAPGLSLKADSVEETHPHV